MMNVPKMTTTTNRFPLVYNQAEVTIEQLDPRQLEAFCRELLTEIEALKGRVVTLERR